MSKIKLPHASGNSMSIAAPATNPASDLELKLPVDIGAAGKVLSVDGSGNLKFIYPSGYGAFHVYMNGQQEITNDAQEVIEFAHETFDTQNWWDTSTYKYTPQVAGIYFFNLKIEWNSSYVDSKATKLRAKIYKNTTELTDQYMGIDDVYGSISNTISILVEMNGSSDYIQFKVYGHTDDGTDPRIMGDAGGFYTQAFGHLVEAS